MNLSTVVRRRFSLKRAAIVIFIILSVLQFNSLLQQQANLSANKSLSYTTEHVRDEQPKHDTSKGVPVYRANLTKGASLHDILRNDITLKPENESRSSIIFTPLYVEKIDWNDYAFYAKEANRKGPGEHGKKMIQRLSDEEKEMSRKLFNEYHYDAYLSDQISVERATRDTRTASCKTQHFIKNIPENSVSVIIVFHNERNSTLLRTVHSVVNRSPATLLREVILVDDLSVNQELKEPLDLYIMKHFKKVKIIRNNERLGLIRSRIAGADSSSGTFLVFFDAHIEVNSNYLPPLLEPMVINYRTIACPMVDIITDIHLNIVPVQGRMRGVFDWSLNYKMIPVEEDMDDTTPNENPVMIGCAFAITRDWWEELEKYDLGLQIWGGEQYEMSFKSWMCGGSVVDAPCSKVAHLFRSLPYIKEVVKDNKIEFNLLRVASVWMDEYKDYIVQRRSHMKGLDPGDLTKQFELKKKLNCKSFDWFLRNVAPDQSKYYPLVEPPVVAWGYLRSGFRNTLCLVNKDNEILLRRCGMEAKDSYTLDWRHHIRIGNKCWANPGSKHIFPWDCLDAEKIKTQLFAWNRHNGQVVNFHTHLCVDCDLDNGKVFMAVCDETKRTQSWTFDHYIETSANEQWKKYIATLSQ